MVNKKLDYLNLILPLILVIAGIVSLFPLILHFKNSLTESYDAIFVNWVLNQTIEKIPFGFGHLFDANIFYPYKNTLAFSELLIPSAIISFVPAKILAEPAVASNFAFLFSQVATLLVIYYWWKDLTKNPTSSFLGTLAIGLSQIRFNYFMHLQMWAMEWWILSGYFLWKFTKSENKKFLYLSTIFLVIQSWQSVLPVFWLLTIFLIIFLQNKALFIKNLRTISFLAIIFLIFTLPVINVYLSVSKEFGFLRSIREVSNFSASIDDYWKYFLSPGLYIVFFLSLLKSNPKRGTSREVSWLYYLLIISFVMSLGPVLKIDGHTLKVFGKIFIPLPYGIFYYIIPGLKALRTPSRWAFLFAFSVSGIIAWKLRGINLDKKGALKGFILLILVILGGTSLKTITLLPETKDYPTVYKWLKDQPGKVVLEYPMYSWGGPPQKSEVYRMFYSLYTKKDLINGYSGFFPLVWQKMFNDLSNPNKVEDLNAILTNYNLKADYIIIHKNELSDSSQALALCGDQKEIFIEDNVICVK